ncbi:YHR132W-A [Saccharomyces arboricola H-6]|uniref:mRNA stability protein n=1 Tax=Saccharomyces arboricola (strain H-6 / AS 2.3317 / CBS 10644) TaxID=1160507 RepID=J8LMZ9_SACAR|nr:YHR132W-A [Saccharomyces arboricola H-6]
MSEDLSPTSSRVDLSNPHGYTKEGVDLSKLSPQELKLYKMYGKLPSKKDLLRHKMQDRQYFDSGDYALKKAGVIKSDDVIVNNSSNNLPVTNPSGLRESIIRRRMSSSSGGDSISRQGSISSGPPPRSPNK